MVTGLTWLLLEGVWTVIYSRDHVPCDDGRSDNDFRLFGPFSVVKARIAIARATAL